MVIVDNAGAQVIARMGNFSLHTQRQCQLKQSSSQCTPSWWLHPTKQHNRCLFEAQHITKQPLVLPARVFKAALLVHCTCFLALCSSAVWSHGRSTPKTQLQTFPLSQTSCQPGFVRTGSPRFVCHHCSVVWTDWQCHLTLLSCYRILFVFYLHWLHKNKNVLVAFLDCNSYAPMCAFCIVFVESWVNKWQKGRWKAAIAVLGMQSVILLRLKGDLAVTVIVELPWK